MISGGMRGGLRACRGFVLARSRAGLRACTRGGHDEEGGAEVVGVDLVHLEAGLLGGLLEDRPDVPVPNAPPPVRVLLGLHV